MSLWSSVTCTAGSRCYHTTHTHVIVCLRKVTSYVQFNLTVKSTVFCHSIPLTWWLQKALSIYPQTRLLVGAFLLDWELVHSNLFYKWFADGINVLRCLFLKRRKKLQKTIKYWKLRLMVTFNTQGCWNLWTIRDQPPLWASEMILYRGHSR
jgi:uncharacterized membrane protein